MSPTSTFLSITVPSMGERMVAQSSVACTSLTVSCARRRSASADRSAVTALSYSCWLIGVGFHQLRRSASRRRRPGRGRPRPTPRRPWPAGAWPAGRCRPGAPGRRRLWTFWPALRLTSTTRASSFEPMRVSCTARIVPTADSDSGRIDDPHARDRPLGDGRPRAAWAVAARHLGRELPRQPEHQHHDAGGEGEQDHARLGPTYPLFHGFTAYRHRSSLWDAGALTADARPNLPHAASVPRRMLPRRQPSRTPPTAAANGYWRPDLLDALDGQRGYRTTE